MGVRMASVAPVTLLAFSVAAPAVAQRTAG